MMKFDVSRDDILQGVNSVQRATATRIIQPILSNILFVAEETGALRLSATDLDFSLQTTLSASVERTGSTTISARKLADILAKLPPKSIVTFDIQTTVQNCKLSCGSATFELRTLPAEEFPVIPTIDPENRVEIDLDALVRGIKQSEFAASKQDSNNILGGIFFKLENGVLDMVATDGSRLARHTESIEANEDLPLLKSIIPAKTLQEFQKLVATFGKKEGEKASISLKDGQVFLNTERFNAVSRLLDGQYPRYEQLIPKESTIVAVMNRSALVSALERTAVMANERTQIVKMNFSHDQLRLAADTPDVGHSQDSLPVQFNHAEELQIAFNYTFVLDALKVMSGDEVRLETNGSLAPTLFRDEAARQQYLCLVMPVQVK
ncbi:MAG: DNA polymerase III subunit beta [Vampirovibrio sp.]